MVAKCGSSPDRGGEHECLRGFRGFAKGQFANGFIGRERPAEERRRGVLNCHLSCKEPVTLGVTQSIRAQFTGTEGKGGRRTNHFFLPAGEKGRQLPTDRNTRQ